MNLDATQSILSTCHCKKISEAQPGLLNITTYCLHMWKLRTTFKEKKKKVFFSFSTCIQLRLVTECPNTTEDQHKVSTTQVSDMTNP